MEQTERQSDPIKAAAWLYADLERSVLGTASRLGEPLDGVPVLQHACRRIAAVAGIDRIVIFCPARQCQAIRELAGDPAKPVRIVGLNHDVLPGRRLSHRKWATGCWRGGANESVWMDEWFMMPEMINYGIRERIELVAFFPPDAVLLDPDLADRIIEQYRVIEQDMRLSFSQAATGLGTICVRIDLLRELHQANAGVSDLLGYLPETPHSDYIMQDCCCKVDPLLYRSPYRFLTDTERSWRIIRDLYAQTDMTRRENWDARVSIEGFERHRADYYRFPREIDIELNTVRSIRIAGYPHGSVPREPMTRARFEKIVTDCRGHDDVCVTLGGFGEPTCHQELTDLVHLARQQGILGVHVETDGLHLDEAGARRLAEAQPDIVSVYLDADSPQGYQRVKGIDGFERAVGAIEALVQARRELGLFRPLVIPHLVKTRQTMEEMERFYDRWKQACGAAVIEGYNDFAGQIEDRSVMDMTPPRRRPCRQLATRMTILADGQVVACGQDFRGIQPVGQVDQESIETIWNGPVLTRLRREHREGRYDGHPLCGSCRQWHRG